ncbi:MAG: 2-oxo-4-hydroxy-4-carboxy-5-ureidoimidazoline decarboxylase [Streptosporangiaceae bacterium]|jgi:2-oxo-4-hydroxy-4-carboxy-5-ureidoimidazoline decarboxylase|nr:decarboxylase [Streptosporangiaceae bacterium]MDX6431422.1 2-oxo-4-hydroxy-4-carboxy-5-ureidoimidazoline decarboxylase [Streptosporangiaceae bacterium]
MTGTSRALKWLNALPAHQAEHELRSCCASAAWAEAVAAARPFTDPGALAAAAAAAFEALRWRDVEEALSAHPRIGDRPEGAGRESAWSRAEQSGVGDADGEVVAALRAGNIAYEQRFGRVFLICASGRSAGEMLDALRVRLGNDEETERRTVRAELAKIVQLRLTKLLERP